MKKSLTISLLFISLLSYGQYQYLKLENNQIIFEKIYTLDSLTSTQIEETLMNANFKDVYDIEKSNDMIRGKLKNVYIDYKKYGYTWGEHRNICQISIFWRCVNYVEEWKI